MPRGGQRGHTPSLEFEPVRDPADPSSNMTTLIRRLGKGYCAAGDGFYFFDQELSRVLQRVAEFALRLDQAPPAQEAGAETAGETRKPAET
jgi:hypothetical protein